MKKHIYYILFGGICFLPFSQLVAQSQPCATSLVLVSPTDDITSGNLQFGGDNFLYASNSIQNATVNYRSGNEILLTDGFFVSGNDFLAEITAPCVPTEEATLLSSQVNNYPNPFSETATIEFSLKQPTAVSIDLYSSNGQFLRSVQEGNSFSAGLHKIEVSAAGLPAGIYIFKIIAGEEVASGRMTLIR